MLIKNIQNQYKRAIWSYTRQEEGDDLCLDMHDVNHLHQIYQKYKVTPETLEKVAVEFIIQRERLSRFIIKELDILLMVGGFFEITRAGNRNGGRVSKAGPRWVSRSA